MLPPIPPLPVPPQVYAGDAAGSEPEVEAEAIVVRGGGEEGEVVESPAKPAAHPTNGTYSDTQAADAPVVPVAVPSVVPQAVGDSSGGEMEVVDEAVNEVEPVVNTTTALPSGVEAEVSTDANISNEAAMQVDEDMWGPEGTA